MTRDKLAELNAISHDIDALENLLSDIKMLGKLTTDNRIGGFCIKSTDFHHSSVVYNLCDKFEPIVKAELERLSSEFRDD